MKSASGRSRVEATKEPPTLTTPDLPMITPLGLSRKTSPEAVSRPSMAEIVAPVTRLRVAPAPLLNCTVPPEPMEKPCQSMIALADDWLTVSWVGDGAVTAAVPATTLAPVGRVGPARAGWATNGNRARPKMGQDQGRSFKLRLSSRAASRTFIVTPP